MPAPSKIMEDIAKELKAAKKKHPRWPTHICAQAGVISEEAGELMREALNKKFESNPEHPDHNPDAQFDRLWTEAVHVAASAIRFLENLKP